MFGQDQNSPFLLLIVTCKYTIKYKNIMIGIRYHIIIYYERLLYYNAKEKCLVTCQK